MRLRLTKAKLLWRKFSDYVRYDFKEIVFPSALPDPPGTQYPRKATWADHIFVWKTATRIYLKSWKTPDIDIDEEFELASNPNKVKSKKEKKAERPEPSTIEDLAVAAKAGSEHIRPALHRIYMTKASAYRDALKSFVDGYQEGLKESLNPDKTTSEPRPSDTDSNTKTDEPTVEVKPDIEAKGVKADSKAKEVNSDIKADEPTVEIKPDEPTVELKPDIEAKGVKADLKAKEVNSDIKSSDMSSRD